MYYKFIIEEINRKMFKCTVKIPIRNNFEASCQEKIRQIEW